jgi:hypothetical protein
VELSPPSDKKKGEAMTRKERGYFLRKYSVLRKGVA